MENNLCELPKNKHKKCFNVITGGIIIWNHRYFISIVVLWFFCICRHRQSLLLSSYLILFGVFLHCRPTLLRVLLFNGLITGNSTYPDYSQITHVITHVITQINRNTILFCRCGRRNVGVVLVVFHAFNFTTTTFILTHVVLLSFTSSCRDLACNTLNKSKMLIKSEDASHTVVSHTNLISEMIIIIIAHTWIPCSIISNYMRKAHEQAMQLDIAPE